MRGSTSYHEGDTFHKASGDTIRDSIPSTKQKSSIDPDVEQQGSAVRLAHSTSDQSGDLPPQRVSDDKNNPLPEDDGDIPEDYENLTEVAGPPPLPVDTRYEDQIRRQYGSLETRRKSKTSESRSLRSTNDTGSHKRRRKVQAETLLVQLYTVSYLTIFAILGTLARLGLQALTAYPNAPVVPSELWANIAGTFIIGFLREDEWLFAAQRERKYLKQQRAASQRTASVLKSAVEDTSGAGEKRSASDPPIGNKVTLPVYIGLSVGFCGSFTSFSSFIRDLFLAATNGLTPPDTSSDRSSGYGVCAFFAVLITEVGLSILALSAGAHLAIAVAPALSQIPNINVQRFANPLVVILGFGCWIGAIILSIWPLYSDWRGQVLFALVFAPIGCLMRFVLSLHLNPRYRSFPLGTFTANFIGTVVLGICWDLQHSSLAVSDGLIGCQVLQGVIDGFSGCLTTVSTWVAELQGLRRRHAYLYGIVSVAVTFVCLVIIMGSLQWTRGLQKPSCI